LHALAQSSFGGPMDNPPISRGFRSRRQQPDQQNRLPPGQYLTTDFPVLSAGPTPNVSRETWSFALQLGGSLVTKWSWAEFNALPQTTLMTDIHCVTKWSKFDTNWRGVTFDDLVKAAGLDKSPQAFTMLHCDDGYTTNVPVKDLTGSQAM